MCRFLILFSILVLVLSCSKEQNDSNLHTFNGSTIHHNYTSDQALGITDDTTFTTVDNVVLQFTSDSIDLILPDFSLTIPKNSFSLTTANIDSGHIYSNSPIHWCTIQNDENNQLYLKITRIWSSQYQCNIPFPGENCYIASFNVYEFTSN